MILTQEQIDKRLTSEKNVAPCNPNKQTIVIHKDHINNHEGRPGVKNLTDAERVAIGVVATVTDDDTAAAIFGVSPSHAKDLKHGNRNTTSDQHRETDQGLVAQIQERLSRTKLTVQERAAEKLLSTLGLFDELDVQDRLRNSSPKEIAGVATQMSQVFRNMNDNTQEKGGGGAKVQVIINAPKPSREEHFETIQIGVV